MKVIKVTDDGTVTIELTATDVAGVRNDLDAAEWGSLTDSAKLLYRFLDMVQPLHAARNGIFPGGGF